MAKKFVRGITDIKNIEHQDFDTNNVNDLLSDGKHNYIHRKKQDGSEEYHNLTNNLKTIESSNTSLLSVTNYNNSTNSAKLTPKHDRRKEQLLESTDNTILIEHGENGTDETTTVDVNPEKVLEHENLLTTYGLSKTTSENTTTLSLEYTSVNDGFDLNELENGNVRSDSFLHSPEDDVLFFVSSYSDVNYTVQEALSLSDNHNKSYIRLKAGNVWGAWREQVGDKSVVDNLLAQKQNTLTSNSSIGLYGTGLRQLYTSKQEYINTDGSLTTRVKWVANTVAGSASEEEFYFTLKINKSVQSVIFNLTDNDFNKFSKIMSAYGQNSSVCINGCNLNLSSTNLTVSTDNNVDSNYVITFCDIIPTITTSSNSQVE